MIRLATKEDLPEISKLWLQMVNELRPDWNPDDEAWIKSAVLLFDSGQYEIVIDVEDSEIVGFLDGIAFYDPAIGKKRSLGQLFYIIPKYRDTDIAESMYEEILVQSLIKKAESLELFCFPDMEEYWMKRGFENSHTIMRMEIGG